MHTETSPLETLQHRPMKSGQWYVVAVCIGILALDGYDVLSIAFGVYLGATFLAPLLKQFDWRISFYLGAFMSLAFIPLVYFLIPETISFIERKRPENALERIQNIMRRLGHPAPDNLSSLKSR